MFTQYTTIEGDRWDTVARKAYGDETAFKKIKEANPFIPSTVVFEGGVQLLVPIIENNTITKQEFLPPWKRQVSNTEENIAKVNTKSVLSNTTNQASFDGSFD